MADAFFAQVKAQRANTNLAHLSNLDIYSPGHAFRKTSIICTIGPKTNSVEKMTEMFHAGMSIVRMNFSHGSHEYHASVAANARKAEAAIPDAVIAIALDTKGPEIRTGLLKDDKDVQLSTGDIITLTTDSSRAKNSDKEHIYVDYANITKVIKPGQFVFMDDGLISLEVLEVTDTELKVKAINSGNLEAKRVSISRMST